MPRVGLALSPREGRSQPQVSSAAESKTKLGSCSAWRVIGASLGPVSIADRRASLADSWLTQDKDSTRLTGPCRLLAERRLQTQALPPNTWAGSPFEQVRLLVGQHAASVPGPHMTASCFLLEFCLTHLSPQTSILPAPACLPSHGKRLMPPFPNVSVITCKAESALWHHSSPGPHTCALRRQNDLWRPDCAREWLLLT